MDNHVRIIKLLLSSDLRGKMRKFNFAVTEFTR